jgi:subtilisin-like proprotein convertase family protein
VTIRPLGGDGSTFGGVLPGGLTFVNSFAELAGGDPNGTWQFYAFDEATGDKGQVAGGWELTAPTRTVALPATGTSGNANPYPSNVVVSGAVGAPLSVRFLDFSHTFLSDLDFALVAPNDRALMLLSNQGGGAPAIHANVTFNDAGAPYAGGPLAGDVTIRPLGGSGAGFGGTLPGGLTFVNSLAELGVGNPNGTWRLFAVDVATGDRGQLADGWQLTFAVLPEPASIALLATGLAGLAIAGVRRRRPSA